MSRREISVRLRCGYEGCSEYGYYRCDTRREAADLQNRYSPNKWRCVRHTRADEVLSAERPKRTTEMVLREEPHGKYWGSFGFHSGPGFKAFGKDFPAGTILRVTAEVVLPVTDKPGGDL
jgi:hypothetical protein